jgi:ribulose-5-phosphate 4-epimerase/fuculose-1-phosphate aldolase
VTAPGDEALAAEVALATRALGAAGLTDMVWGHLSLRDPADRGVWMKASGWSFDEVTDDRVVLVSPDGAVLAGEGRRHIEYPIHTRVMAARPDVRSVVHTHSAAATAFAALQVPLRALSHDGVEFAEPDVPRFTRTGSLIRTAELGDALAACIGTGVGALVPQHGLVTVGPDLATAVMRAVLLDRACSTQLTAMAAGPLRRWSDSLELALKRCEVWPPAQLHAGYAHLTRLAARTAPEEEL